MNYFLLYLDIGAEFISEYIVNLDFEISPCDIRGRGGS